MITPLTLGNSTFPTNLIQGPLAGVSTAPFRELIWQYSQPAFSCSEMISCKTILHQRPLAERRFLQRSPAEGPVCFQLASNNKKELAEATKIVTDSDADLIDLNCGCPKKKIRSKGSGSRLLTETNKLYELICAMRDNTHLPISIKIRVEGNSDEKFNHELASMIADSGIDFVTVHGRHWTETYEAACHYDQIQFFVEQLKIPVIGNGDIACQQSLTKMFATGCAGVMTSRASVGQPWLIRELIATATQQTFTPPPLAVRGKIFHTHIAALATLLASESLALLHARKLAKYYTRGLDNRTAFCEAVNACQTLPDLEVLCGYFFKI